MNTPTLPALLASNPRLDQWVGFPAPGCVTVSTGRVEIGQGVLTAMLQIAAEELDVAPERILHAARTAALRATRQLAKRQYTWLRAEPGAAWVTGGGAAAAAELERRIGAWRAR